MPNFGQEAILAFTAGLNDKIVGGKYTCPLGGVAQSISIYLKSGGAAPNKIKCAIYDASRNFVAGTVEKTAGFVQNAWNVFDFTDGPVLLAGTDYILVAWADTNQWTASTDTGSPSTYWSEAHAYNGWPAAILAATTSWEKSIFCTYLSNVAPTAPTGQQVDGQSSPTGANCISSENPQFSAIYNDPDAGDQANAIQIQVGTASGLSDMWDSSWIADSTIESNRCTAKTYAGAALSAGTSYWWRCRFRDDDNAEGAWSEWQQFDMCAAPALNLVQMALI